MAERMAYQKADKRVAWMADQRVGLRAASRVLMLVEY